MIKDKCCDWPKEPNDGLRVMTTARYPRGRTKDICDVFVPDIAPDWHVLQALWNEELTWAKFVSAYKKKLRQPSQRHQLEMLAAMSETHGMNVTVMCACENRESCHRSILVEEIKASYQDRGGARKVYPYCVYHIKLSGTLQDIYRKGGAQTLVEKGNWRSAANFLGQAQERDEQLLLLLDHAEQFQGIGWKAVIEDIVIRPLGEGRYESRVTIKGLEPLAEDVRFPHTQLRRAANGDPLGASYQRGYVPCVTPGAFLRA